MRTLNGHSDAVLSVAISPDSQVLVSSSADRTIRIWNLSSYTQPQILIGHSSWVNSVAISPNGNIIASGSADSTIKLWNLHTGELLRTLTGHSSAVLSVAISPDGETLTSSSTDGKIKLWNLHAGELLHTLSGGGCVVFSPDGKTLISGGNDGTIKIWQKMASCNDSAFEPLLSGEWWEVLGVDKDAVPHEVKLAYRRLARQYHPDVSGCCATTKAEMQAINQAYVEFCCLK
jgi:WD40 repeat protein